MSRATAEGGDDLSRSLRTTLTETGKRATDVILGTVLAVAALPVIVVLAIALGVSLRTNPFFLHQRVGRFGRPLWVVKLRTLPIHAPRYADRDEIDGAVTTPLAAAARRLHLDELPQLFFVPLGQMSLVGPRPEMAHMYDDMAERQAGTRLHLPPGCTGLWQISVAYSNLIKDAPEYDIFYIEHRTLRLDLWILWRTALMMFGLAERVELSEVPRWTLPARTANRFTDAPEPPVQIDRRRRPRRSTPTWRPRIRAIADRTREVAA